MSCIILHRGVDVAELNPFGGVLCELSEVSARAVGVLSSPKPFVGLLKG
jgi:hypothetical protein